MVPMSIALGSRKDILWGLECGEVWRWQMQKAHENFTSSGKSEYKPLPADQLVNSLMYMLIYKHEVGIHMQGVATDMY